MARMMHCWRCGMDVPMLEEEEWAGIATLLADAHPPQGRQAALSFYFELTGYQETNINAVAHHRIAHFGLPCRTCGRPLRTPEARFCAACGEERLTTPE